MKLSVSKRLAALLLAVMMLLSMLPFAFAEDMGGEQPPTGNEDEINLLSEDECAHVDGEPVVVPAACGAEGSITVSCTVCGEVLSTESTPATGVHTPGEPVEVPATCGADGTKTVSCTVCSAVISSETIAATGAHTPGEAVSTATCADAGTKTISCTVCSAVISSETIAATGVHTPGEAVSSATCVADGVKTVSCTVCGTEISSEPAAATGVHSPDEGQVTTPATCTEAGVKTFTCTVCSISYTEEISATGHSHTEEITTPATCTAAGVKSLTCPCGDSFTQEIPAGHTYENGVCTVCGAVQCIWRPDCPAAEHEAGCIKGNVDKATVLFDALVNELALTDTITAEVEESIYLQMYGICELEANYRAAWAANPEYQMSVWNVIVDKLNLLVNELPAADSITGENFDAVKAQYDKLMLLQDTYRQIWYTSEREPDIYNLLMANENFNAVSEVISRGAPVTDTGDKLVTVSTNNGTPVGYDTLQGALNAIGNTPGNHTIVLNGTVTENITINQLEGQNIVLDGQGNTLNGVLTINGGSRELVSAASDTLRIEDVVFNVPSDATGAVLVPGKTQTNYRYAHNVTIVGCTFNGNAPDAAAFRSTTGGDYNIRIYNCTVNNGLYSLMDVSSVSGIYIQECNVYSRSGVNLNSSSNVIISYSEFDVTTYAVRAGVSSGNAGQEVITLNYNTLSSRTESPVVLRGCADNAILNMEKNTVSAIEGQPHILGTGFDSGSTPNITADNNYWGGGEPVVSGTTLDVDSYYDDAKMQDPVFPNAIAKIGNMPYETLQQAIAAAQKGDTIELLADVELTSTLFISSNSAFDKIGITINGNGKTIKAVGNTWDDNMWLADIAWDVAISNLTFDGGSTGCKGVQFYTSNSSLNNVTFQNFSADKWGYTDYAIHANASELTLNGVSFENCWHGGHIVVDIGDTTGKTESVVTVYGSITGDETVILNHPAAKAIAADPSVHVIMGNGTKGNLDGHELVYKDGSYVPIKPVAKIGEKLYETLEEAIDNAANGDTITLIKDIAPLDIIPILSGKAITLDLNGFVIDGCETLSSVFDIQGSLTVKDGSEAKTGVIKAGVGIAGNTVCVAGGGSFVLQSGTIYSKNNAIYTYGDNASVTVSGGTVTAEKNTAYSSAMYLTGKVNVDVSGGNISGFNISQMFDSSKMTISGGSLEASSNGYILYGSSEVDISGSCTVKADNNVFVTYGNANKIKISNGTITSNPSTEASTVFYLPQPATVEISGGTLSGYHGIRDWVGSTITMSGGSLEGKGYYGITTYAAATGAEITLSDNAQVKGLHIGACMYSGNLIITDNSELISNSVGLLSEGGNTTISGNAKLSGINGAILHGGTVTISGGTISGIGSGVGSGVGHTHPVNSYMLTGDALFADHCSSCSNPLDISINGGTFVSKHAKPVVSTENVSFISGGTYSAEPEEKDIADGYAAFEQDSVWVVAKAETRIGNTLYPSLYSALAAANDGNTVVLLADIELTEDLFVSSDITIDPNGKSISYAGGEIVIANDTAVLTISGDNYDENDLIVYRQLAPGMCVSLGSIEICKNHTGGTATCYAKAKCTRDGCGQPYGKPDPNNHSFTYAASGDTITETCAYGCDHKETAKIERDPAVSTVYTGSEIKALQVTYSSDKWKGGDLDITYSNNKEIGTAKGTISVGGVTASANFEISAITYTATPNNLRYVRGSGYPLSFTTNVPYSAANALEALAIYRANGTLVMNVPIHPNYVVLSSSPNGMTVITLSAAVMNSLEALNYELVAVFAYGAASTPFRVLLPFIFPMTGDEANALLMAAISLVALGGAAAIVITMKKKQPRYKGRH